MKHATWAWVFGLVVAGAALGGEAVKIEFDTPAGWRGETLKLPTGFAPDLALKGIEEIRFAPGMFKADQEDFFSYALVFYLPDTKPLDQKTIHTELLKYYRGLAKAVRREGQKPIDTTKFELTLEAVKDKPGRFAASLEWVEPFSTRKPQTLYFDLKAAAAPGGGASYLSMAASPQKRDHAIWKAIHKVLDSVRFTKAGGDR